jgi:hypothetical protein
MANACEHVRGILTQADNSSKKRDLLRLQAVSCLCLSAMGQQFKHNHMSDYLGADEVQTADFRSINGSSDGL